MSTTKFDLLKSFFIAVSLNAPTLLSAEESMESVNFFLCNDHIGQRVQILDTTEYDGNFRVYLTGARYLETNPISVPAIILDFERLKNFSNLEIQFTLAHECYHLSSGDAYFTYEMLSLNTRVPRDEDISMELRADCAAAQRIRELGIYQDSNYLRLRNFLSDYTSSSRLEERLTNLQRCLR